MHAAYLSLLLALNGQLSPANQIELSQLRPVPEQQSEPIAEAPRSSLRERRSGRAPAAALEVTLEAPAQSREPAPGREVTRASFDEHPADNYGAESAAAVVLKQALTPHANRTLAGQPYALLQAIRTSSDRSQQVTVTRSYWRSLMRIAEYHWSSKESVFLASLAAPKSPRDQMLLATAQEASAAHEIESELAALAAQRELGELVRLNPDSSPRPSDIPLVSNYKTNFELIYEKRTAPGKIAYLARSLPVQNRLVNARASSVQSAEELVLGFVDDYEAGSTPISNVLTAFDRLVLERRGFLNAVRDYNLAIADYSLAVVSASATPETLVSTLVHRTPAARTATQPAKTDRRSPLTPGLPPRNSKKVHEQTRFHEPPDRRSNGDAEGELSNRNGGRFGARSETNSVPSLRPIDRHPNRPEYQSHVGESDLNRVPDENPTTTGPEENSAPPSRFRFRSQSQADEEDSAPGGSTSDAPSTETESGDSDGDNQVLPVNSRSPENRSPNRRQERPATPREGNRHEEAHPQAASRLLPALGRFKRPTTTANETGP